MSTPPTDRFLPLTGVFEPSAVVQLPDGRFLVAEDEKDHPLSLLTIGADGTVECKALSAGLLQVFSSFWNMDDLEGLTVDRAGHVYAMTSHSRTEDGSQKKSRERLVRFRVEGDRVVEPLVVDGVKAALVSGHPVLAAAARIRDVKDSGGLNIEGLDLSPDQQQLLIGFRSPLHEGRALMARIDHPGALFDSDEAPRLAPWLDELDLGGHGIRGLSYVPALQAYLVIAGPVSREPANFELWCWSGQRGAPARRVTVPGLPSLEKAEGLCPAVVAGAQRILVVSDDGSRAARRAAHYVLLDPARLQIAG